jgi:putative transcriptional regulator
VPDTAHRSSVKPEEIVNRHAEGETSTYDETLVYVDPVGAAIHESAEGLARLGLISAAKMKEFDDGCLVRAPEFSPAMLKRLREREQASQAVLARYLGVSLNAVSQWERGERRATGAAAKLLSLVEKHGLDYIR